MVNPGRVRGEHDVFVCGNDPGAKETVTALMRDFGWRSIIDLGNITAARATEQLMPIWINLYRLYGTADFNFRIVLGGCVLIGAGLWALSSARLGSAFTPECHDCAIISRGASGRSVPVRSPAPRRLRCCRICTTRRIRERRGARRRACSSLRVVARPVLARRPMPPVIHDVAPSARARRPPVPVPDRRQHAQRDNARGALRRLS